jgi:hypothetical protein
MSMRRASSPGKYASRRRADHRGYRFLSPVDERVRALWLRQSTARLSMPLPDISKRISRNCLFNTNRVLHAEAQHISETLKNDSRELADLRSPSSEYLRDRDELTEISHIASTTAIHINWHLALNDDLTARIRLINA